MAGTRDGITALQMDIKVGWHHARRSCVKLWPRRSADGCIILDKMNEVISELLATKISAVCSAHSTPCKFRTDKIRDLIGPGGKMIRSIIEQTGVKIDVEDYGKVNSCFER